MYFSYTKKNAQTLAEPLPWARLRGRVPHFHTPYERYTDLFKSKSGEKDLSMPRSTSSSPFLLEPICLQNPCIWVAPSGDGSRRGLQRQSSTSSAEGSSVRKSTMVTHLASFSTPSLPKIKLTFLSACPSQSQTELRGGALFTGSSS